MGAAVLIWIVMGFFAGLAFNKVLNRRGEGAGLEIVLGIVGAVVGGWLCHRFGAAIEGFNARALLFAVLGAAIVLVGWHLIRGSASRA